MKIFAWLLAAAMPLSAGSTFACAEPVQIRFKEAPTAIAFHPKGWLAVAKKGGVVEILRRDNVKLLAKVATGQSSIREVAFSPDGQWMATASIIPPTSDDPGECDRTKIWKVLVNKEGIEFEEYETRLGSPGCVAFSPNSSRLATAVGPWDGNQCVEICEFAGRQWHSILPGNGRFEGGCVSALAFSPDGRILGVGTNSGMVYLVKDGKASSLSAKPVGGGFLFTPDGNLVFQRFKETKRDETGVWREYWLSIWDVKDDREIRRLSGALNALACSGKWIVTGEVKEVREGQENLRLEGRVRFWDLAAKETFTLDARTGPTGPVAFSADGKDLAALAGVGEENWHVLLWRNWQH